MWLRVMPELDPGKQWLGTDLKSLATTSSHFLIPLGSEPFHGSDTGFVFSNDGFGIYVHRQPTPCVAFVFRTGEVWGIDAHHLVAYNVIPFIEPFFINAFENYTKFVREQLGVSGPYHWIAGIEGVKGRPIDIPRHDRSQLTTEGSRGSCLSDIIVIKGTHGEGANPRASLRTFFVEVYDRCAVQRPDWMDDFPWPPVRY
jgi:hypothetical protein